MVREAELLHAIDRIYAAAADGTQWRSALEELTSLFGGRMANLELHDTRLRRLVFFDSIGGEPHETEPYERYYVEVCPRVKHLFETEAGSVHCDYSWFSEREMGRSEFYEDFLARNVEACVRR